MKAPVTLELHPAPAEITDNVGHLATSSFERQWREALRSFWHQFGRAEVEGPSESVQMPIPSASAVASEASSSVSDFYGRAWSRYARHRE